MEEVTFHGEPPSNVPTMVVAFGGWIDAGEAATGALRSLVRQLGATPLASIDPEDFCRFYPAPAGGAPDRGGGAHHPLAAQCVLDLAAARGGRGAVAVSGHGAPAAVAHLRHGAPGRRRALWGAAASCRWGRSSWTCPIPAPRTSRAAAPTRAGTHGSKRGGSGHVARATKARPALRRSSWTRRRAAGIPVAHRAGASAPLSGGHDQSGGAPGAADRGRAVCSTWSWMCPTSMRRCRPFGRAATRRWPRTPRPRPMCGNSSRPMTRRVTRRRAHAVTTPSTRSS